jgi:phosphoribosylanthranilate isomerase
MIRTWIKFCGTTSLEDAQASIDAGADALGFIFVPSKRRITPEAAQQIVAQLPRDIHKVGVFMNETAEQIQETIRQVGLTLVQLHGDEPPEYVAAIREQIGVIKTILVNGGLEDHFAQYFGHRECADYVLLDSGAGSGLTFDWRAVRPRVDGHNTRLIVAGGLTPANVGLAMHALTPWGVDVVTGVEAAPGKKDPAKLRAFVAAVRKSERL